MDQMSTSLIMKTVGQSKKKRKNKTLERKIKNCVNDITMKKMIGEYSLDVSVPRRNKVIPKKNLKKNKEHKDDKRITSFNESLFDEYFSCVETNDEEECSDSDSFSNTHSFFEQGNVQQDYCSISCGPFMYSQDLVGDPKTIFANAKKASLGNLRLKVEKAVSNKSTEISNSAVKESDTDVKISIKKKKSQIRFFSLPNNVFLIIMKPQTNLYIQGQLNITVVMGSIEVLGYKISNLNKNGITVYSHRGSSQLCLQTVELDAENQEDVDKIVASLDVEQTNISHVGVNDCLLLVKQASSSFVSYLSSHCFISLQPQMKNDRRFFQEETKLQCKFETDKESVSRAYTKLQEWDDLADHILVGAQNTTPTKVMVCGGKSVGKSTFLRFLINKNLTRGQEILYLDFDPGQSEFTVPGCVSVVKVKEPVLGPNYTHILSAERMVYLGEVDVSKCPDRFIKSAKHIIDYCNSEPEFNKMVWFINTMGFSKGLGVELTTSLICMVKPTHLVQIQSKSKNRNYPKLLIPENVSSYQSRWHQTSTDANQLDYSHHTLLSSAEHEDSPSRGFEGWGMQSKTARDIMVLSYMYYLLKPPRFSLTDVIPYKTSLTKLKLSVSHESLHFSQYLSAMNANLVALCAISDDNINVLYPNDTTMPMVLSHHPIEPCLGFGIVRGIDVPKRVIYLLTPLSEQLMSKVNCLVMGTVMLPTCIYTGYNSGYGHVPYVANGPEQVTSREVVKRFRQPMVIGNGFNPKGSCF